MARASSWLAWLLVAALPACGRLRFDALDDAGGRADGARDATMLPWTLVQVAGTLNTFSIGLAPTQAGSLLVVATQFAPGGQITSIVDDAPGGSDSFVAIAGSRATDVGESNTGVELWYATGTRGGATTVTITSTTAAEPAEVWEVAGIASANALDAAGAISDQAASATPSGPAIVTTAPGDFVVAVVTTLGGIQSVQPPFTLDSLQNTDGWAHLADPSAPAGTYQVTMTSTPGTSCATTAAFLTGP